MRYKMVVSYDGTEYAGWQAQPEHRTVQGELERTLTEITGEEQRMHSSGRTDAGVHALGQVVHFDLEAPADSTRLATGLNALLDPDIRVLELDPAEDDFHARFHATGKEYRYFIINSPILSPFDRRYRTHIRNPLNLEAMQAAARHLVGEHDFAAFAANPNREIDGTVRHVTALDLSQTGELIQITAKGNGFLYKMVRSLAGFLIRVGTGELEPSQATEILASKVRTARVPTAAPQGLFLWQVFYE